MINVSGDILVLTDRDGDRLFITRHRDSNLIVSSPDDIPVHISPEDLEGIVAFSKADA